MSLCGAVDKASPSGTLPALCVTLQIWPDRQHLSAAELPSNISLRVTRVYKRPESIVRDIRPIE